MLAWRSMGSALGWGSNVAIMVVGRRFTASVGGRKTYFDLLDLPISAEVSHSDLQRRYHALQSQVHPDQTTLPASVANETSALASKAYAILKDDYSRCRYLSQLSRNGRLAKTVVTPNSVAGDCVEMGLEDSNEKMPPDFLSEIMEISIEVNTLDPTHEEGLADLRRLRGEVEAKCNLYWDTCRKLFGQHGAGIVEAARNGTAAAPPTAEEEAFHSAVRKWTYYNNLRKQLYEILA
jgi:DnaJ-domain-containing protein 1